MHRARLAAMVKIVDGVVFGGKAMLAELGRGIRNHVLEKHNVKCADRLIGNAHLGSERPRSAADKPRSELTVSCSVLSGPTKLTPPLNLTLIVRLLLDRGIQE